ncbi:MAG: adenylate/guanylate cyclase domain-containing protein [Thaumarchaeota archaeon]|nr:adenylate/guanylate cyclase domain-containing protein [Nitrososphaerota archaeon]
MTEQSDAEPAAAAEKESTRELITSSVLSSSGGGGGGNDDATGAAGDADHTGKGAPEAREGSSGGSTASVVDMLMGKAAGRTLDFETMIRDTQIRVWKSLKEGYEYESIEDESDRYLRKNVLKHIEMAVMYVDLVGSTQMALEISPEKVAIIMSSFAQEMAYVIKQYNGYVLKFVGDAVIGYFVAEANQLLTADNAVNCARSMISVIRDGINPILDQYDYPELKAKIGIDSGQSIVVRYGSDAKTSHVDLIGPVMNIAAKIQNKAAANHVLIGSDVYDRLHPETKDMCSLMKWDKDEWSYRSRKSGGIYSVYEVSPIDARSDRQGHPQE